MLALALVAMATLTLQEQPQIKRADGKNATPYEKLSDDTELDRKSHPCDQVKDEDSENGVRSKRNAKFICKRYTENELLNRMNCSGTFNKIYLAVTRNQAKKFPNLAKRLRRRKRKKGRRNRKLRRKNKLEGSAEQDFEGSAEQDLESARQKRNDHDDLAHGEVKTLTEDCLSRWSMFESILSRPCGVCPTLTRQPQSPRRFPEYLNGLICHPEDSTVVKLRGHPIGRCVQETITLDLVQWTGQWVEDTALTSQNGVTTYVEKWEAYEQEINSTCSFSFYRQG